MIIPSKLHLACSKEELRPSLNCVYFTNDFAYASDGHLLIRLSVRYFEFEEGELENVSGKMIHRMVYQELIKKDTIAIVPEKDSIKRITTFGIVNYKYVEEKAPDYENVIPKKGGQQVDEIGLNPAILNNLFRAMLPQFYSAGVKLSFYSKTSAIKVTAIGVEESSQIGIIMPVMIN